MIKERGQKAKAAGTSLQVLPGQFIKQDQNSNRSLHGSGAFMATGHSFMRSAGDLSNLKVLDPQHTPTTKPTTG
uniref:Uncharacterized protein n=1 Tax=Picea glauca TaxID=3330 RepID=A0A101LVE3_PICGL|nr:hypothetical protein ABT39_MTgene2162 [Picea glauca]QHR87206.1 hypothetical protein Q903MT_gene1215 [Picea sitchensis]